jgi:hypothetical protein
VEESSFIIWGEIKRFWLLALIYKEKLTHMSEELLGQLSSAQKKLEPQLKALNGATGALKQALKVAGEEHPDALAMQKVLAKLQQANALVEDESLQTVTATFAAETQTALDALAFQFARDLKEAFEQRGQSVGGRPPTLVVDPLVLHIDIANRKAQWFYGKEELTRPIALSIATLVQAYDRQKKAIVERTVDVPTFVAELHSAWTDLLAKRTQRPAGGRVNLVELYSQVVLNRQSARFWNAPSRSTFKDYERVYFVRDLLLAHGAPAVEIDGQTHHLRLGVATKSQADSASRSIWLPQSALDGEYYANITFERAEGE